ncbi:ABC transporter ATP-binding protein [Pukyongiella litopenaei]|nr:ABC transporter ATP-binding protein [Pukyongiella litopenaei]
MIEFFRFLWPYLAHQQGRYLRALVLTFFEAVLATIPPLSVGLGLVILIRGSADIRDVAPYAAICFLSVILRTFVIQHAWRRGIFAGDHAAEALRNRIVEHMRNVPLGVLSGRWSPARLATLIVEDGRWFNETAVFFLIRIFQGVVATVVLALMAAWFAPVALIVLIVVTAASLLVIRVVKPIGKRVIRSRNDLLGQALLRVGEFADGIAVFRAYGQSGNARKNLRATVANLHDVALDGAPALIFLQQIGTAFVSFAGPLAVTVIAVLQLRGVTEFAAGAVTPALLLTLAAATTFIAGILRTLLPLELGNRARINISEFLSTPELPGDRSDFGQKLDIAFKDVSFSYGPGKEATISNLSFQADPGSVTAIVGPSGAGKSTLVSLLLRFHERTGGAIKLAGIDISQADPAAIQARMSLVSQDVHLFRDTLRTNLLLGDPDASEARLSEVIGAARLTELVKALPDGLDTMLGDTGRTLSGGERQRVAIARALLKDAPILILDEATSALDPITERAIQDALAALEAGRSVIIIAHRLHTVVDADQILVVDNGQIVERGTHDTLLENGGLYGRLWAAQEKATGWRLR